MVFRQGGRRVPLLGRSPCLADLRGALDELGDSGAKNRRQVRALVATWWLIPSCGIWRVGFQQAVQLGVDVQARVLVVVMTDQEYPDPVRFLGRDDNS